MESEARLDVCLHSTTLSSTQPSSHHKSATRRRNEHMPWLRHRPIQTTHLLFLILFTCCLSFTSATQYIEEQMIETQDDGSTPFGSGSAPDLARFGQIVGDPAWTPERLAAANGNLRRREEDASTKSTSVSSTMLTSASTSAPSSASTSVAPIATSDLPVPFDIGFSNNITTSCMSFMTDMLTNDTFTSCLPFSLLLQYSAGFFNAEKSITRITQVLDYTCKVNFATCSAAMAGWASNITSSKTCSEDLTKQNPLITYAQLGLESYRPLYQASCLHNPSSTEAEYCFADAITSSTNPADSFIYYLPYNDTLPGGSQPTCSTCLKNTMAVFQAATSDRSSALISTYPSAALDVNINCGPSFVNASLAAAVVSGAQVSQPLSNIGILALVVLISSWLL